jgi:hypothetical protein
MAGLEVVVRPVVFPNIRPSQPRVLAPEDKADQGFAVIGGGGGKFVSLSYSFSHSMSAQLAHREGVRQFNKERVYQVDEKGNINKTNYVDLERMKRVRLQGGVAGFSGQGTSGFPVKLIFADPPQANNVETLQTDVTRYPSS